MLFFNANFICYYFYPTKKREEPKKKSGSNGKSFPRPHHQKKTTSLRSFLIDFIFLRLPLLLFQLLRRIPVLRRRRGGLSCGRVHRLLRGRVRGLF